MTRRSTRALAMALALLAALLAVIVVLAPRGAHLVSSGAGLAAGHLCSGVFVAGRSADAVRREELRGLHDLMRLVPDPALEPATRSAVVRLPFGMPARRAVHREGFGCAVLPPGASAEVRESIPTVPLPAAPADLAARPWPEGDRLSDAPLPPEIDPARLEAALETAFDDERYAPSRTLGVVVVYRGRLVAERYAPGWGPHAAYRTWSTAKSLTGALVGVAVGQGRLALDAPPPIPEWSAPDDPRRAVTLRHLLHMSSGLASTGAWTPDAYWGGIDTAHAAADRELEADPGTRWKYSNLDTLLLVRAVEESLGGVEGMLPFPHEALLDRIGMHHTVPETDPYGHFILSSQVYSTPRDLARFALLHLQDGVWEGERILPEGWVDFVRTPAPAAAELPPDHEAYRAYGAQFWLYGRDPRLPDDAYSTGGARGQHATIVPSRELVVVRTGLDPIEGSGWDPRGFAAAVLEAIRPVGDTQRRR